MKIRPKGMFFEEFHEGDQFHSASRTITDGDITAFAGVSGDYSQIHTDEEFAAGSVYNQRVAHGLLGLSIVSGLAVSTGFADGTAVALRKLYWKFTSPVYIGDTIAAAFKVVKKRKLPGERFGLIVFSVDVSNQNGLTVQSGIWHLLISIKEE